MEKLKLIFQGFYGLARPIIGAFYHIGKALLFLFIKIMEGVAFISTFIMQVVFISLFSFVEIFVKYFYCFITILIKFIFSLIKEVIIFLFFSLKFFIFFCFQLLFFIFSFIKNLIFGLILFLIGLPFRIIFICLSAQEKKKTFSQKLKKSMGKRRLLLWRHQYQYYLKKYGFNRIKVLNSYIRKSFYTSFNFVKQVFFKIGFIFKKVVYNIYYAINNAITFVANLILVLSLLVKSSFLVIISIFTKNFWYKFFNEVYNLRIFFKLFIFESLVFIRHSKIFIRNILLFVWLDILNFKKMGNYIRNNIVKFFSTLCIIFFLAYGFFILVFNSSEYDRLSKKWENTFLILNTSNIISKIIHSELFKPLIYYKTTIEVNSGSNLYNSLIDKGIDNNNATDVINALKESFDLRKINPSWTINSVIVSSKDWEFSKIQKLSLPIDNKFDLVIEADNKYNYTSYKQEKKLTRYILRRKTLVKDSIYSSAIASDISPAIAMEVFKVLSWDIDFQRDIKENNSLEVIFECVYNEDDDLVTCDNLLFASIVGDKVISFYKFNGGYYHEDGRSVIKTLVKTPINNSRLSSGFGIRKHPVLGYTAVHKGVDFAAPIGTPVYASGNGTVEMMYRSASYGNYIRIRHNPYLSSAYAHLNGFAKGIKVGSKVNQWQLIAYVGATGRVTGPHLHYEILVNGKQVNPLTIKMPSNMRLTDDKLQDFKNYKSTFNTLAIRIPTRGKIISPLGVDANFDSSYNKEVKKESKKS